MQPSSRARATAEGLRFLSHPLICFDYDMATAGAAEVLRLVEALQEMVEAGSRFAEGDSLQYGWFPLWLRVIDEQGLLQLLQPPVLGGESTLSDDISQALQLVAAQRTVNAAFCLEFLLASIPSAASFVHVCDNLFDGDGFVMMRTGESAGEDEESGFFFGCLDETHDHQDPANLSELRFVDLGCRRPQTLSLLAMPVGCLARVGPGKAIEARVRNRALALDPASPLASRGVPVPW
jgi:hypothetical protein